MTYASIYFIIKFIIDMWCSILQLVDGKKFFLLFIDRSSILLPDKNLSLFHHFSVISSLFSFSLKLNYAVIHLSGIYIRCTNAARTVLSIRTLLSALPVPESEQPVLEVEAEIETEEDVRKGHIYFYSRIVL